MNKARIQKMLRIHKSCKRKSCKKYHKLMILWYKHELKDVR